MIAGGTTLTGNLTRESGLAAKHVLGAGTVSLEEVLKDGELCSFTTAFTAVQIHKEAECRPSPLSGLFGEIQYLSDMRQQAHAQAGQGYVLTCSLQPSQDMNVASEEERADGLVCVAGHACE